jgi:predicted esterase
MPLDWSQQSSGCLLNNGLDVEYHKFYKGHTITAGSLAKVSMWLEKRLANL